MIKSLFLTALSARVVDNSWRDKLLGPLSLLALVLVGEARAGEAFMVTGVG